ncbi:MAG TPA: M50 family metallopeptidase [Polyangia bacterium]|nr:M50 family metallopeptidase [Polyangia bacterium]
MLPSYRIGSLLGFSIRLNLSLLLLLGAVFLWMGRVPGVLAVLFLFGSVVLHELGHSVMARRLGVRIASIDLHFFGGAARMVDMPRSARDEIAIAAAGPAVSFALGALGLVLGAVTGAGLLTQLGWVNVVLGAFNLLPVFPSDGGRILRALLAPRRGLVAATDLAVKIGRFAAIGLGVYGVFHGPFTLAILAFVLWSMGAAEQMAVRMRGAWDEWRRPGTRRVAEQVEYLPPGHDRPERRPPRVVVWRF